MAKGTEKVMDFWMDEESELSPPSARPPKQI